MVGMQDKRLLICDDEAAFGRFVQNVAEDLGYEVRVTTDGRAFIEAYKSFKPTMIILDMIMPGMDGNEIVLWLAQQKCTARLIIITGYTPDYAAHAKVLAEYKGLRPVTTLYKPIEVSELRAVLGSQNPLGSARQENQGRGPTAWEGSMGEYKRFALLVFVIIGPLLIVGASAGHAAQAEPEEVVAAVARDFYPEYVVDADGRPGGFGIDLMNAVAKRAGLSVTYRVFEAWSDLIAALERGDADVVPLVSVTRAREGRMLFTRPVVTSPSSLFVRQDTGDIRGWSDLAGRRVGVIKGGVSEEILSERETSARLVPYARLQDALFGLLSGEVDALVSFQSSVWKVSERARLADRIKVVGDPLTEVKRAIAVRQDLPGLRDRLDAAVAEFLNSSEYSELYSKWYAAAPSFWTPGRSGWVAGASMALLLLGMLVWQSLSLRAENRRLAESAPGKLPGARAAAEFPTRAISRTCGLMDSRSASLSCSAGLLTRPRSRPCCRG